MQKSDSNASKLLPESGGQDGSSYSPQMVLDVLKQAALSAREGNHLEAENLLEPLCNGNDMRMEFLDLLAKIYAQQGKINQAQDLWIKALAKDPSNLRIFAALRVCEYHKKPNLEHFVLRYSWMLVSIVIWLTITMFVFIGFHR
ncbi:tetratricopeptide repeat protein [Chloroflexota bacterium]